jgi:hypothetical protein
MHKRHRCLYIVIAIVHATLAAIATFGAADVPVACLELISAGCYAALGLWEDHST